MNMNLKINGKYFLIQFRLSNDFYAWCALLCECFGWCVWHKVREIFGILIETRARGTLIWLQIVKEIENSSKFFILIVIKWATLTDTTYGTELR